jgi:hypothetical protein
MGDYLDVLEEIDAMPEPEPEPIPLTPEPEEAPVYPIESLPPLMRSAAKAIADHVQAPLGLAGQVVIGAAAALAQTRANAPDMHLPDGMPCSLFMLTLADSGDRKSACRKLAFRMIDELERENRNRHREQCKDANQRTKGMKPKERKEYFEQNPLPPDPRTQYSDLTFERLAGDMIRGMSHAVLDTDEGGQLLAGSSIKSETRTATLGGLCKAFDSGRFERDRSAGNDEGSGFAYHRRLSVILLAQEVAVAEALNDPLLRGQGFLPRFLFASTTSLAGTRLLTLERLKRKPYADPRLQAYWERCRAIQAQTEHIDPISNEVLPPVMPFDTGAEQVWMEFYNEIERQQGAGVGEFEQIRPFAGRSGEIARRLATVFAVFEQRDTINSELMQSACEIVRHSCREWSRYESSSAPHADLKAAQALFDWLTDPERAEKWQVFDQSRLCSQGPTRGNAKRRNQLLGILTQHNYLLTGDKKLYRINPKASVGAQTAQTAQTRMNAEDQSAHALHTTAQNSQVQPEGADFMQPLCSPCAPETPATTGLCAEYALYAGMAHEKTNQAPDWEDF